MPKMLDADKIIRAMQRRYKENEKLSSKHGSSFNTPPHLVWLDAIQLIRNGGRWPRQYKNENFSDFSWEEIAGMDGDCGAKGQKFDPKDFIKS